MKKKSQASESNRPERGYEPRAGTAPVQPAREFYRFTLRRSIGFPASANTRKNINSSSVGLKCAMLERDARLNLTGTSPRNHFASFFLLTLMR